MSEASPLSLPVALRQVTDRMRELLLKRRQSLHRDSDGSFHLVDLTKAKALTPAQLEALAREVGAVAPFEVIIYPG